MPGWIITGVRGEGKTLAAVGKIKEYALRGRPIATNLDLYLDKFLPDDNLANVVRLPDKPRLEDFELLPPAYDVDYKAEDMNGLLVLDELGTWLNSRSWNDKTRLPMLNWLFLSRKLHWDIIILAQDYEMIDAQVRNTLCDYWVQSSRLDRQKIPYLAPILETLGFNSFMPRVHRYFVFYGFNAQVKPVETWTFSGKDFYDGYNTNQLFKDGLEYFNGEFIDTRRSYSYLPAAYLSGYRHIKTVENQLQKIKDIYNGGDTVAAKKTIDNSKTKAYMLIVFLVLFVGWRVFGGGGVGKLFAGVLPTAAVAPVAAVAPAPQVAPVAAVAPAPQVALVAAVAPAPQVAPVAAVAPVPQVAPVVAVTPAPQVANFMDDLLANSQPRLSWTVEDKQTNDLQGAIEFYQFDKVVERFKISELHALGVGMIRTAYGFNMLYKGKTYLVPWAMTSTNASIDYHQSKQRTVASEEGNTECVIKTVMTAAERRACQS